MIICILEGLECNSAMCLLLLYYVCMCVCVCVCMYVCMYVYVCIMYVFCIYLITNSEFCHLHHKLIGVYNRDEKCLQRGTDWVFK